MKTTPAKFDLCTLTLRGNIRKVFILALLVTLMPLGGVVAQASTGVELVKDINPGPESSGIGEMTSDSKMVNVNGTVFFWANDGIHWSGLWKSDGTAPGTVLVKDINPGSGSVLYCLTNVNGTLFFVVDDGIHGDELWKSDGTEAGTVLVKDINPGSGSSSPYWLTNVNGTLFFAADDGIHGSELWKSDGTEAGTVLVKDIIPGSPWSAPSYPMAVNGTLFFFADDGIHGWELWKSDGTEAGTMLVKDINPNGGSTMQSAYDWANVNGTLFFVVDDGIHGYEVWKSDGTEAGTKLVKAISPLWYDGPRCLTELNGILFFAADDGIHGWELWKSDGTEAGTSIFMDINEGPSSSWPFHMINVNGTLFFQAYEPILNHTGLWKSDGTAAGTVMLRPMGPGGEQSLNNMTNVSGTLFFTFLDWHVSGGELWKSDGTGAGTVLVEDIYPGPASSNPQDLTAVGGTLFFVADDGIHGRELWKVETGPLPGDVPVGTNVEVTPVDKTTGGRPVTMTFSEVTVAGTSSLTTSGVGQEPPAGFALGDPPTYYDLTTDAGFSGPIQVCIDYSGVSFVAESSIRLYHLENGVWVDRTVSLNTENDIICASVTYLSPFAIFELSYNFVGFNSPVKNPPAINIVQAGRTVPLKWQLVAGGGGYISDLMAVTSIAYEQVSCQDYNNTMENPVEVTETSGISGLHYDSIENQYIYNWKSDITMTGKCYMFTLTLYKSDKHRAIFKMK